MLEWLLLLVAVAVGYVLYTGTAVPTPVPRHIAYQFKKIGKGSLLLTVYRLLLVTLVLVGATLALFANLGAVAGALVGGVVLWIFMDDLQQTLIDIWNADFWVFKP